MKNIILALVLTSVILRADEATSPKTETQEHAVKGKKEEHPGAQIPDASNKPVITQHTVSVNGKPLAYEAETGMIPLLKEDGSIKASVFYVAYTLKSPGDTARRPVMFCMNGGPGAASVWLHLGGLGPRRALLNENGTLPTPPFSIIDNDDTLLTDTDLVFIDPVSTGFSRAATDEKQDQFFGQDPDIKSVAEFIRLYTSRHGRWRSPKYLCGESYGAFRVAGLAEELQSNQGMFLNGVALISGITDFGTIHPGPGNDLPYLATLPSFTATAQFHHKLPPDLQDNLPAALEEARTFASTDYANALYLGCTLDPVKRAEIVSHLSRLTGLPEQLVSENNLRIDPGLFRKRLLEKEGLICGAYDGRITANDGHPGEREPGFDPSFIAALGPISSSINAYIREELKFESDLPYKVLANVDPWKYDQNTYASTSDRLARAMTQNQYLKVLILSGSRDLVCPGDAIRYSINHMPISREARSRVSFSEFEAGHMMYLNLADLKKLKKDLGLFLK